MQPDFVVDHRCKSYPLTAARHGAIRKALDQRDAGVRA